MQLNCICDHAAKQRIAINGSNNPISGWMFPLEPIGAFVDGKKMMSETGGQIRFWAHRQLARDYFRDQNILSHIQFDAISWPSIHCTLHDQLQLFQLWASKHVLGTTGTIKFLAHQVERSPLCPSCLRCKESCSHIAHCPEEGWAQAFEQSAKAMEVWLDTNKTHPDLQSLLLRYLQGRDTISCSECAAELNLLPIIQEFALSQDIIG